MPLDNPRSDFSSWFSEVILRAGIVDNRTPIKGSNVLMPNGVEIWESIKIFINREFKATGHKNYYFPLFIPEEFLKREKEHFGISIEVAWVTQVGETDLNERFALRPTSETIMYHMFAQWIHSHADLPFKINQWANIIRWDTKNTRPLLRDREFFWSEGHTAHATYEEAAIQVEESMTIYQKLYDALCLSYMVFRRPEHDKFPGAEYTIAYDGPLPNNRVLQLGTTHHLGQKFAKPFDVKFLDKDGKTKFVHQTSYGFSTRLIAAILALHGDDQGLILPPMLAPTQIVIIPIIYKGKKAEEVLVACNELKSKIEKLGYRVHLDDRDGHNPGWKFAEWEMQGVPLRLEIGPRDLAKSSVYTARRDTLEKEGVSIDDLEEFIPKIFEDISKNLKSRADKTLEDSMREASNMDELIDVFTNNRGIVRTNWCGEVSCAEAIKDAVSAEIRGTKEGEKEEPYGKCVACDEDGQYVVYIASAY